MSPKDATRRDSEVTTSAAALPGKRRAGVLGLAAVGFLGLISTFTCSDTALPAGQNGITNGLCSFPRSCYLVNASGPNAGLCDDCSSTSRCRLVFTPDNPSDYQSLNGTWKTATWQSSPTDWQAVCGLYSSPSSSQTAICATPETVCVARGPACNGYCVHAAAPDADGGTADMGNPAVCAVGTAVPPQRRPGASSGGTQTYCALTDDVCCALPASGDGGAAGDGGVTGDGGVSDGGVTSDGGAAADAAPVDQRPSG